MSMEDSMYASDVEKEMSTFPHYYGDAVRKLFFSASLIMLLTLPFFSDRLPVSTFVSLLIITTISVVAGITHPKKRWPAIVNMIVAFAGVIAFEYEAVTLYQMAHNISDIVFLIQQGLALLFFCALYLATKTVRWMTMERNVGK